MNRKTKIAIWTIFIFAVAVRLAAYFILRRHESPLFWEYHEIADNFLSGKGLCCSFLGTTHYAYLEPFYPLFSAFFYKISGHNYMVFGAANILFSAVLTFAVFYLAKIIFGESTGLTAASIVAVHPGLIYYSTQFHPLTFDVLFFTLVLLSLVRLSRTESLKDAFLAGAVIGLAFSSRSSMIIFIPIAVLIAFIIKVPMKYRIKLSACILLVSLSVVAAWSIRNYAVLHRVIVTRSTPGWLLWLGNNPNYTGSAMSADGKDMASTLGNENLNDLRGMDELGQNKYFTDSAFSFIKKDPAAFFIRWASRYYYFWWFTPEAGYFYPAGWMLLYKLFYMMLLVPAILAMARMAMSRSASENIYLPGALITIVSCLLLAFAQTAFYTEGRHRWVVEPVLAIFSAWFFVSLVRPKEGGAI